MKSHLNGIENKWNLRSYFVHLLLVSPMFIVGTSTNLWATVPDDLNGIKLLSTPDEILKVKKIKLADDGSSDEPVTCSNDTLIPKIQEITDETDPGFSCEVILDSKDAQSYISIHLHFVLLNGKPSVNLLTADFKPEVLSKALKDKLIAKYGKPSHSDEDDIRAHRMSDNGHAVPNMTWRSDALEVRFSNGHIELKSHAQKNAAKAAGQSQLTSDLAQGLGSGGPGQLFDIKLMTPIPEGVRITQLSKTLAIEEDDGCSAINYGSSISSSSALVASHKKVKTPINVPFCFFRVPDSIVGRGRIFYSNETGVGGYEIEFDKFKYGQLTYSQISEFITSKFGNPTSTKRTDGSDFETTWNSPDFYISLLTESKDPHLAGKEPGAAPFPNATPIKLFIQAKSFEDFINKAIAKIQNQSNKTVNSMGL